MRYKFLTVCSICLASVMFFSNPIQKSYAVESSIKVTLDGTPMNFPDAKPFTDLNGRTLIPVRFVSESLGATVDWDKKNQEINITKENNNIKFKINDRNITVNGILKQIDTNAIIKDSRTFVPVRFVAEALQAEVQWIKDTKTVAISTKTEMQTYEDTENGFSFKYTNAWVMDGENSSHFSSINEDKDTGYSGSLGFETDDLSDAPKTFEEYKKMVIEELSGDEIKMENVENKEFCGLPGCYMTYSGNTEGNSIKGYAVWTIKDNIAYIVSYFGTPESFEKDKAALDIVIKSAKIKK